MANDESRTHVPDPNAVEAARHAEDPGRALQIAYDEWEAAGFAGECPVRSILDRIGDRWTVLLVLRLKNGPHRFGQLKRDVHNISQRMLTHTLRALERDGIVSRTVKSTRPPSVEYALTETGRSLLEPLAALTRWSMSHGADIARAQQRFGQADAQERFDQTDAR